MNSTITTNSAIYGGGGYHPSHSVLLIRTVQFVKKNNNCLPCRLKQPQRAALLYTLIDIFGFTQAEIQRNLKIPHSTSSRDLSYIHFLFAHSKNKKSPEQVYSDKLRDYILYNARYLPYNQRKKI